jgi:tetratricopeptide (TPR) repeat protein
LAWAASLGLIKDRLSWNVLVAAARLATKMAFAEAKATLDMFMPNAPSTEVIEKTVLGLGEHVAAFIEQAPAPEGDGEVLVIQFDGKGAPTATARELARRRRKRKKGPRPTSKRHRGRTKRGRYLRRPRRKKGDKAKNARVATAVVMQRSALERQVEALRAQGERAGQQRDYATAIKAYRQATVISPREELINALAALHMKRGGPDDAQDAAFLYVRMSERAPAERVRPLLERALACDPECEQALARSASTPR